MKSVLFSPQHRGGFPGQAAGLGGAGGPGRALPTSPGRLVPSARSAPRAHGSLAARGWRAPGSRPGEWLPWQPRPKPRPAASGGAPVRRPTYLSRARRPQATGPAPRSPFRVPRPACGARRGASDANTRTRAKLRRAARTAEARGSEATRGHPRPPGPAPPGQLARRAPHHVVAATSPGSACAAPGSRSPLAAWAGTRPRAAPAPAPTLRLSVLCLLLAAPKERQKSRTPAHA